MNNDEVWSGFCDTYNGIRDVFVSYDQAQAGAANPPNLANEWQKFVKAELQRLTSTGKAQANLLWNTKKSVAGVWGPWWKLKWTFVMNPFGPAGYIKLQKTCRNLQ